MTRIRLTVSAVATLIAVVTVVGTQLLLPTNASFMLRLSVVLVGLIFWITGASVYLSSRLDSTLGCLLLNLDALVLVCAALLSTTGSVPWALHVSLYSALAFPPLLVRSFHVFNVGPRRLGLVEHIIDALTIATLIAVTLWALFTLITVGLWLTVALVVAVQLTLSVLTLVLRWRAHRSVATRRQIVTVIKGSAVQFIVFFALFAATASTPYSWLWVSSSVILSLSVWVSLVKGRFMDVELHRSFVYLLLTSVLAITYVVLILLAVGNLIDDGRGLLAVLIVSAVSLSFLPLARAAKWLTDFAVYRDHYDFRGLLRQLSDGILHQRNSYDLGAFICTTLLKALNLDWCVLTTSFQQQHRVIYSTDPAREAFEYSASAHELTSVQHVPLVTTEHTIGEIVFAVKRPHGQLRSMDEDLLSAVGLQAAVMLENFQLIEALGEQVHNLQEAEASRRVLHRRLSESEETTRANVSRDLHDGALQSVLHLVRMCELDAGAASYEDQFERIADLGRDIAFELREVCSDLRPHLLDHLDLPVAIENLLRHYRTQCTITAELNVTQEQTGERRTIGKHCETILYRLVNEALTNVLRHAKARRVIVHLTYTGENVCIDVRDDGIGFSVDDDGLLALSEGRHMGIIGMFERIKDVDGKISVTEHPLGGTELTASIPIREPQNSQ